MKQDSNEPPSELFFNALSRECMGSGAAYMECHCGRVHLCPDTDYDQGEHFRENCEASFKENPDTTVLHYDVDGVMGYHFAGSVFVEDCPCNSLTKYENFIWQNRSIIRRYLKDKIDLETRLAQEEKTLNVLAGIDQGINYDGTWK